jgi:hypothetical protein
VSCLPNSATGASGEVGVDLGCVEFERLDKATVVEPVAARLTRALGVPALHEASAKTVPASSPNRMIVKLGAGKCVSVVMRHEYGSVGITEEDHVAGACAESWRTIATGRVRRRPHTPPVAAHAASVP